MARRARQSLAFAFGAWLAGSAGAMPAAAQSPQMILRTPQEVTNCLCMEFAVNTAANDVAARQRIYEDSRRAFQALDAELNQRRTTMNPSNPADVESFRALLDRRNEAFSRYSRETTPEYGAVVEDYNRRVSQFNQSCSGRSYDATVLAQVRQSLICPAQ
jgi:hypothetical protein